MIKVGSNVLTRNDGKLNVTRMSAIVDQVVWLRRQGYEVILVSSGAVAAGRAELSVQHKLDSVEQRQLFSAIGQVKLTGLYYDLFREYGIRIGQVLTMKENFASRREYLNQRACMGVMLDNGVVPIVNGIDYNVYDPQTDGRIYCNYNASDFRKKKFNNKTVKSKQWCSTIFACIKCLQSLF